MVVDRVADALLRGVENDFIPARLLFGIGLKLNKLAIDLRYERGLTEKETRFVAQNVSDGVNIDLRPSQLILSLFIEL